MFPPRLTLMIVLTLAGGYMADLQAYVPDRQPLVPQWEMLELPGRWKQIYVEFEGEEQKQEYKYRQHWVISEDTVTMWIKPGFVEKNSGGWRYKLRSEVEPAGIDLMLHDAAKTTFPSIYRLEGNRLTVCLQNYPARGRPKDFTSRPGSGIGKFIFERVAP